MAKAKKKTIVKSAAVSNAIAGAIDTLTAASTSSAGAIAIRAKDAKKFSSESKRLAKKKAMLAKRKTATTAKLKKEASASLRKLLKTTVKELADVTKAGSKNRAEKSVNSEELTGLKVSFKRVATYIKVIEKAEKVLSKPKKKKKKSKRSK